MRQKTNLNPIFNKIAYALKKLKFEKAFKKDFSREVQRINCIIHGISQGLYCHDIKNTNGKIRQRAILFYSDLDRLDIIFC